MRAQALNRLVALHSSIINSNRGHPRPAPRLGRGRGSLVGGPARATPLLIIVRSRDLVGRSCGQSTRGHVTVSSLAGLNIQSTQMVTVVSRMQVKYTQAANNALCRNKLVTESEHCNYLHGDTIRV